MISMHSWLNKDSNHMARQGWLGIISYVVQVSSHCKTVYPRLFTYPFHLGSCHPTKRTKVLKDVISKCFTVGSQDTTVKNACYFILFKIYIWIRVVLKGLDFGSLYAVTSTQNKWYLASVSTDLLKRSLIYSDDHTGVWLKRKQLFLWKFSFMWSTLEEQSEFLKVSQCRELLIL